MLGPLVQQRLHVRLGEHAAAGGDGVQPDAFKAQLIQLVRRHIQKHRHLVDKGSRAAGTGAVHALVDAAVKKDDLRVLAAQLDDGGGVWLQALDHLAGGEHLLHKGHEGPLGQTQTRRAGDGGGKGPVPHQGGGLPEQLQGLLPHLGEVALIFFK